MKKIEKILMLLLFLTTQAIFMSCNNGNNDHVTISDNGKVSNGAIFSEIDDENFYLNHIKYTVKDGCLVVSGYDKKGFTGKVNIVANITYKGIPYEVLAIGSWAFSDCFRLTSITIPNSVYYYT